MVAFVCRHQAITWINIDLSAMGFGDQGISSQDEFEKYIGKITPLPSGDNELMHIDVLLKWRGCSRTLVFEVNV